MQDFKIQCISNMSSIEKFHRKILYTSRGLVQTVTSLKSVWNCSGPISIKILVTLNKVIGDFPQSNSNHTGIEVNAYFSALHNSPT
jgi:hypothetical protein